MTTNIMDSFLTTAMEMLNSMMHFTGCELHSHKTRGLLEGLRMTIATFDGDDRISRILLLIDALLEEEGIAEAETAAYHDYDDYEDSDEYYDDCLYDEWDDYDYPEDPDYIDPEESVDAAFNYLDDQYVMSRAELDEYLAGDTIEDMTVLAAAKAEQSVIDEYVNTPHDELNRELKEIDREIKEANDRKFEEALATLRKIFKI